LKPSKRLTKYFLRQSDRIHQLLKKPIETLEEGDFHLLRVHTKKIKAILNLAEYGVKDFPKEKYFTPYKIIFSQAGKIRELQLQISLMKKYKSQKGLNAYYSRLEKDGLQHHQDFLLLIDKKLKRKLKKSDQKIVPFLKKVDAQVVKDYLSTITNRIRTLLHEEKLNAEQVHDLRKHIKELKYLQKIFQPKNKLLTIPDDFQELIGQWHDYAVISKDLLKDAQHHELKPEEVKAIMSHQKKISNRADQLLAKVEIAKANI
jgi:CHAD domain-containing protein